MTDHAKNLIQAREAWRRMQNGWALDLVRIAQDAYDANTPEGLPPNRPMTTKEQRTLDNDILAAFDKTIDTTCCKVGEYFTKAECETCSRIHNAVFTDPRCVDHG
jgi:hypothetical protein